MKSRIMYIECKTDSELRGPARIGRVTFTRTGASLYYRGRLFHRLRGPGFKSNYFAADTGDPYWISGCKKAGGDRLYPGTIEIDDDVREKYWAEVRGTPERAAERIIRCSGKYAV